LDQKDRKDANGTYIYQPGPMKAAYGTFLASLLMIKCHDMVADVAATKFNVTWSRTTPIAVSVLDDAYEGYMTLECDHGFGMDVTGDPNNIKAFRFACSSAINPIEYWVMKALFPCRNASLEGNMSLELYSSITIGLGQNLLNGKSVDIFMSNGYMVIKSLENNLFLVFDPETGILRDVMVINSTFSYSTWCYSDQQTEWAFDLGESILANGTAIMAIMGNMNGTIDFGQISTNTKNGLIGFLSSAMVSLEGATMFLDSDSSIFMLTPLMGLNVVGLAVANAAIASTINEHADEIEQFVVDHQAYIPGDVGRFIILTAGIYGITATGPIAVVAISFVGTIWAEGELILNIRDHYLPKEYWKYISYHHSWLDGYEVRTYIGEDNCIHYIEIPKNPDGTLRMEDAVYI